MARGKNSQWIASLCFQEVPQEHLSSLRKGREEAKAERERQSEELLVSAGGPGAPIQEGSVPPGDFLAVGIRSHRGRRFSLPVGISAPSRRFSHSEVIP